jgi:anti-sigma B factor antagonist
MPGRADSKPIPDPWYARVVPYPPLTTFRARARRHGDAMVIVAEGELDLVGAPRLLEVLPEDGDGSLVLDRGGVGFMDSSGLRALLEARRRSAEAGRRFAIARPSDPVLRVLELVHLATEFEILAAPPPEEPSLS